MKTCPACGRENLNVYSYCQGCGRGFAEPEPQSADEGPNPRLQAFLNWLRGRRPTTA